MLYYLKKSISLNNDIKNTWRFVNEIMNKEKRETITSIKNNPDNYIAGETTANYFNDYFTKTVDELKKNIPPLNNVNLSNLVSFNNNTFFFSTKSQNEIQPVVFKLKDKHCHINDIPAKILKFVSLTVNMAMEMIFNKYIGSSVYPNLLKCVCITPIYKFGDRFDVGNYCPISNLPSLSKIF